MKADGTVLPLLDRVRTRALIVGILGAGLSLIGLFVDRDHFNKAYLYSFVYVFGLTMGSMALLMVHRQLGGAWGFLIRRPLESAAMTIPLVAIFFIPVLVNLDQIYPWVNHPPQPPSAHAKEGHGEGTTHAELAQPNNATEVQTNNQPVAKGNPDTRNAMNVFPGSLGVKQDPLHADTESLFAFKRFWLNPKNFTIRVAIYFAIWIVMATILNFYSWRQDELQSMRIGYNLQSFSAPGIVIYFLTVSLAMVDWGMSLEPDWYSSLYGVVLMIGQGISTIGLMILVTKMIAEKGETDGLDTHETYNDLGNLLLAFTMLWTYLSFSQYLIIWAGNLSEEIPWYKRRLGGGWMYVGQFLMLFHFLVPFLILLCRPLKRNLNALWKVALLVMISHLVYDYWIIVPSFGELTDDTPRFLPSWLDFTVPAGLGGIWFAAFLTILRGKKLMVTTDPELLPALKQAGGH